MEKDKSVIGIIDELIIKMKNDKADRFLIISEDMLQALKNEASENRVGCYMFIANTGIKHYRGVPIIVLENKLGVIELGHLLQY